MKVINKSYRFLSALALILFLNSFILPVGLSAASLYCNMTMDMGADRNGAHTCLGVHSAGHSGDMLSDNEVCSYQQICEEALSLRENNKVEAIPQLTKSFTPVLGYIGISVQLTDDFEMSVFPPEPDPAYTPPPIFLLNGVFLN